MLARLCKNSIFPINSAVKNNSTDSNERNVYHLPNAIGNSHFYSTLQLNHHQRKFSSLPVVVSSERRRENNSSNRIVEPPPPYEKIPNESNEIRKVLQPVRLPLPPPISSSAFISHRSKLRSRVENYRNRNLSDSENSDSERHQSRHRSRSSQPRKEKSSNNHKQKHSNEVFLDEDLFCPDLVRNCKSLSKADDNDDDQDYIEIEELTSQLSLHNEVGLPTIEKMGQNLSNVKRPKISLTWVLREQQQAQQSTSTFKWNEKNLFRKTSKSHEKLFSEKYVSDYSNDNLHQDYFCKINGISNSSAGNSILHDETKLKNNDSNVDNIEIPIMTSTIRNEKMKRFHENCFRQQQRESIDSNCNYDGLNVRSLSQANLSIKNGTYSEPSIYVTSPQSECGFNRRYRRRRKKSSSKFGYNIKNVNDFLSKCSLLHPANIPMVLSNASILYQTRTGTQIEIPIPLGMVVNAIFKNQNWLYIQTPHNEEGYVNFEACLPLGIIQKPQSSSTKCWETNTDIFPSPSGNHLTDSEKEIQLRGGTRSECGGRRTPKIRKGINNRSCSEKYLDSLYLLASQPKIKENSYAPLKPTNRCNNNLNNDYDYVQLKHHQEKMSNFNSSSQRQMLLAITDDFFMDSVVNLKKGDVVKLLACKEYEDKLWYFVKNREGHEFYIPSEIANEYL